MKIGIIGCGNISKAYLTNLTRFKNTEVVACADLALERAREKAAEFNVPKACSVDELLGDPEVEIIVNLTTPQAHAAIALAALKAGKHVYGEKPLALDRAAGSSILKAAKKAGKRAGSAPDTFLGGGHQTCRKIVDEGQIGKPVGAVAFMMSHGHESWHPEPAYYYQPGAGPMFDMGPYYLTALINLLGPVRRLTAATRITFPKRIITSQPNFGKIIKVRVPTYVASLLEFACGAIGTIITTFDVWHSELPRIEVYGTEGSLSVPDPNMFGGKVRVRGKDDKEWRDVPLTHGYDGPSRGLGVADMAAAILGRRSHRANAEVAFHVLDIMQAMHESAVSGRHIVLKSTCKKPLPLPVGLKPWEIDV